MAGEGSRQVFRAVYFLIAARALGVSHFGEFVGVTAMIAVLSPFASLGSGNLLIKHVSVKRSVFGVCWGNALFMCLVSGAFLLLIALAIRGWVLSNLIPFSLVLWVGMASFRATQRYGQDCRDFKRRAPARRDRSDCDGTSSHGGQVGGILFCQHRGR
jgi:O-antigen/teichoic acid export membrane protein